MSYEESDLEDFIVSDEDQQQQGQHEEESVEPRSRLADITNALRPGEDRTQKVLKAHISVLVSALGGPDHTSQQYPPPYKLGHEALACLKDLKRWIKTVDERLKSYDVALACADSGLVVNDLIVIMCQWERKVSNAGQAQKKNMEKILLSCLELLVLLTWPVELSDELSDKQKLAFPNLKKIQVNYKKHILSYNDGQILKAVLRLILPHLTKQRLDREPRDNAIIRMALFFVRNILFIGPATTTISSKLRKQVQTSDNLPANVSQDDISINTTIKVFEKNNVLKFLLTIVGSLGTNFDKDVFAHCSLECIYLIVKKIDPSYLIMLSAPDNKTETANVTKGSLASLLQLEHKKKAMQKLSVSTRHGRFGTLLSIQSKDSSYVISGQEALHDTDATLAKLDKTKKWHTRTTFKYDSDSFVSENMEYVLEDVKKILMNFLDIFLDSGCFNNMIESVAWLFTSNGDLAYSDAYEKAAHFLTIAWFFKFKRLLNYTQSKVEYGSVGVALNETNFILLLSYIRASYDAKDWNSVHVALLCFKELLLISHSIFTRKHFEDEEEAEIYDRELAEGIIHKLFETKQFLDLLIEIPKTAAKHSPDYLNVCVSVVNQLLKTFECFSNQDIALYVKTKKRQSKKKKNKGVQEEPDTYRYSELVDGSDEEENERRLNLVTKERRLDFGETEVRFFHPSIVTTHISYLSRYEDLSHEEIKKAISYFHRLFVIRKDVTNLYRLDFMQLIHKLRADLPSNSNIREVVDDFIYYFMKRFKEAFKRFPLPIEILFPRIEDMAFKTYLGSGDLFVKEEKRLRPPKLSREIEFTRNTLTKDDQFKILVTALFEAEHEKWVDWFVVELKKLQEKRIFDENEELVLPTHSQYTRSIISSSVVRLLLSTLGFKLPVYFEQECTLPTSVTSEFLSEAIELIQKWVMKQPAEFDDGNVAAFYLRAKDTYGDGDDDFNINIAYDINDDSIAFETRGDFIDSEYAKALDDLDQLEENMDESIPRKKRRKGVAKSKNRPKDRPIKKRASRNPPRFNVNSDDEDDKPIKSSEYVRDSDDESDDEKVNEFFQREEKLRSMIEATGGIVNAQQLAEFKKAWENMKNGETPAVVQEAINVAALGDLDSEETSQTTEITSQGISPPPAEDLHSSSDGEAEKSKTIRKRKLVIADEDDE